MFYYIFCLFGITAIYLYRTDYHLVIKNITVQKYRRWKKLTNLVATTEKNSICVFFVSSKIIFYALYIAFLQYMNSTVRRIDRKTYEVTYVINGKIYKMNVKPKAGPSPIVRVSDELNNDVTSKILPYIGPEYNWHENKFTPVFFGFHSLTFLLSNGTIKKYNDTTILPGVNLK